MKHQHPIEEIDPISRSVNRAQSALPAPEKVLVDSHPDARWMIGLTLHEYAVFRILSVNEDGTVTMMLSTVNISGKSEEAGPYLMKKGETITADFTIRVD